MPEPITTYADFWPYYLREHARPGTRWLHFAGTTVALGLMGAAAAVGKPVLLAGSVLSGYGFAWASHFRIERNRPATFKYPLWSLASDFRMWALMVSGRLGAHLARAGVEARVPERLGHPGDGRDARAS